MKALNSLKSSNIGVYFEEDLYFPTYFLEVHFSTAFLTHFILRISTHHASYKNPNLSVPECNGVGRKENVRIKVKWRMFRDVIIIMESGGNFQPTRSEQRWGRASKEYASC